MICLDGSLGIEHEPQGLTGGWHAERESETRSLAGLCQDNLNFGPEKKLSAQCLWLSACLEYDLVEIPIRDKTLIEIFTPSPVSRHTTAQTCIDYPAGTRGVLVNLLPVEILSLRSPSVPFSTCAVDLDKAIA